MSFRFPTTIRSIILAVGFFAITSQIAHEKAFSYPLTQKHNAFVGLNFNPKPIIREEPTFQEKDIFILVNYYRKKNKMKTLKWDSKLAKLARFYSKKMARDDYFEHTDRDGKTVVERAADFRIKRWRKIGENLFYSRGLISPSGDAVESWLDSPGHRVNMLDKDWTHTAIGVYEESFMVTYITQVFLEK